MIFRSLLWYAIVDTKYWDEYISLYIDRRRRKDKVINITLLLFSLSGILGWKVWEPYPAVICVVLGIWQMLDLLRPNFVSTREEYDELKQIRYLSNEALSHLERLWVRLYENGEEAGEIQKVFFEQCVPEMNHIKSISDSLIVPCNIKSIQKAAEAKILNYKKRYE